MKPYYLNTLPAAICHYIYNLFQCHFRTVVKLAAAACISKQFRVYK